MPGLNLESRSLVAGAAVGLSVPVVVSACLVLVPSLRDSFWRYVYRRLSSTKDSLKRQSRPKRIILVRHGQSEGNVDESVYARKPDNQVTLTEKGAEQASAVGRQLKEMLGDEVVRFYVSPFRRTVETFQNIAKSFDESKYTVRIEPRLREQEWGNLQDHGRMPSYKRERWQVGIFYYRFPDGESGADVYDRITTFMDSLFREFKRDQYSEQNLILVSHGITCRMFLMRFFRWTPEMFHQSVNPGNCQYYVMEKEPDGSYRLQEPDARRCTNGDKHVPGQIFPADALRAGALDPHIPMDPAHRKMSSCGVESWFTSQLRKRTMLQAIVQLGQRVRNQEVHDPIQEESESEEDTPVPFRHGSVRPHSGQLLLDNSRPQADRLTSDDPVPSFGQRSGTPTHY